MWGCGGISVTTSQAVNPRRGLLLQQVRLHCSGDATVETTPSDNVGGRKSKKMENLACLVSSACYTCESIKHRGKTLSASSNKDSAILLARAC